MLKIGLILFAIGLFLISPLDELILLGPLYLMDLVWIVPLITGFALICFIVGAVLIGRHLIVMIKNPLVIGVFILTILLLMYCIFAYNWISL